MPQHKSEFQRGMEILLNSPNSILTPQGKQLAQQLPPSELIKSAGKKKRNEDKERIKARMALFSDES